MTPTPHFLFASTDLEERGRAFTFRVRKEQRIYPAFAIRSRGEVKAYLNVCAHVGLPVDARRGDFWYLDGTYLSCKQHGAIYDPDTGECVRGPCIDLFLIPVHIRERNGRVCLDDDEYSMVIE